MHDTPVPPSPAGSTVKTGIDPIFLSVREAAKALALSPKTVYRLMDSGDLDNAWHGTRRLVVTESLRSYAKKLLEAAGRRGGSAA
jgi:excisionase family DNA binding protein